MQKTSSKRVILTFPSTHKLWAFAQTLSSCNLEINTRLNSLICDCNDEEVQRAVSAFDANLLQEVELA